MGHKFTSPSSPSFNNTFCLPLIVFQTQSSHIRIGTKIVNKDSIRTAIEDLTKISKFHAPTDSEHKFHKARIEN